MKRKHHARPTPKGPSRTVTPAAEAAGPRSDPGYPRARDAADVVERACADLARMLRGAARPLVGATAASLLFGAMMGGCMPVVRPEAMPERTPASEMLDEQAAEEAHVEGRPSESPAEAPHAETTR